MATTTTPKVSSHVKFQECAASVFDQSMVSDVSKTTTAASATALGIAPTAGDGKLPPESARALKRRGMQAIVRSTHHMSAP